jgi:hypothetical protein
MRYAEYLWSLSWRRKRKRKIREQRYTCEWCGRQQRDFIEYDSRGFVRPFVRLEVHHKTYAVPLGQETLSDLECLCTQCHPLADMARVLRIDRRCRRVLRPETRWRSVQKQRLSDSDRRKRETSLKRLWRSHMGEMRAWKEAHELWPEPPSFASRCWELGLWPEPILFPEHEEDERR